MWPPIIYVSCTINYIYGTLLWAHCFQYMHRNFWMINFKVHNIMHIEILKMLLLRMCHLLMMLHGLLTTPCVVSTVTSNNHIFRRVLSITIMYCHYYYYILLYRIMYTFLLPFGLFLISFGAIFFKMIQTFQVIF